VDLRAIGLIDALAEPVALGILLGLVVGKPIGVFAGAWITARFTRASLAPGIAWRDVAAIGVLAGIGFTVALLIAELGYEGSEQLLGPAKAAILTASVIATVLAAIVLTARRRHYDRVAEVEEADVNEDGIPDVYQQLPDSDSR
jgi:NhaA family Na+:H+ antiporter